MHPSNNKRTISLSWKLTGFFAAFGLLLTYAAFVAFGGISTHTVLRIAANTTVSIFTDFFDGQNEITRTEEGLLSAQRAREFARALASSMRGIFPISRVSIFARLEGGEWVTFIENGSDSLSPIPVRGRILENLENSTPGSTSLRSSMAWGARDNVQAFIGVPSAPDGSRWCVGALVDRDGLTDFFRGHKNESAAYVVVIILLSLILGRIASRRFIRPLEDLANSAASYASGRTDVTFSRDRRDEIGVLSRTLHDMSVELEKRRVETEERLRAMEAMNKIDKAVLVTATRGELLGEVAGIVDGFLSAKAVAIALRDSPRAGWDLAALVASQTEASGGLSGDAENGGALFSPQMKAAPESRPFLSDEFIDTETALSLTGYYESSLSSALRGFAVMAYDVMGVDSGRIVASPMYVDGSYLGSLAIVLSRDEALSPDVRRAVSMLADQAAVALRSILSYEEKEDNFFGILKALTQAIDAKSKWTAGHSERVANLALRLGAALLMSERELRTLKIAAILHDAGKIGVNEAVLDKPGRLTPEEYEHVRRHPVLGGEILAGIRSFEEIRPVVVHHHERWDGTGYPDGLAGEDIPFDARIVAIADVWESITDNRPYRMGLSHKEARRFMEEQSGRMFDPRLLRIFLELIG